MRPPSNGARQPPYPCTRISIDCGDKSSPETKQQHATGSGLSTDEKRHQFEGNLSTMHASAARNDRRFNCSSLALLELSKPRSLVKGERSQGESPWGTSDTPF